MFSEERQPERHELDLPDLWNGGDWYASSIILDESAETVRDKIKTYFTGELTEEDRLACAEWFDDESGYQDFTGPKSEVRLAYCLEYFGENYQNAELEKETGFMTAQGKFPDFSFCPNDLPPIDEREEGWEVVPAGTGYFSKGGIASGPDCQLDFWFCLMEDGQYFTMDYGYDHLCKSPRSNIYRLHVLRDRIVEVQRARRDKSSTEEAAPVST